MGNRHVNRTFAKVGRWAHGSELPRFTQGAMEVRATASEFEWVRRALDLIEEYEPAARRRVERNVSHVIAIQKVRPFYEPSIGTVFLRFEDFSSEFELATVLLFASLILVRGRGGVPRPWEVRSARAAIRSAKRLVRWRARRDPRQGSGHSAALLAWLDSRAVPLSLAQRLSGFLRALVGNDDG